MSKKSLVEEIAYWFCRLCGDYNFDDQRCDAYGPHHDYPSFCAKTTRLGYSARQVISLIFRAIRDGGDEDFDREMGVVGRINVDDGWWVQMTNDMWTFPDGTVLIAFSPSGKEGE